MSMLLSKEKAQRILPNLVKSIWQSIFLKNGNSKIHKSAIKPLPLRRPRSEGSGWQVRAMWGWGEGVERIRVIQLHCRNTCCPHPLSIMAAKRKRIIKPILYYHFLLQYGDERPQRHKKVGPGHGIENFCIVRWPYWNSQPRLLGMFENISLTSVRSPFFLVNK